MGCRRHIEASEPIKRLYIDMNTSDNKMKSRTLSSTANSTKRSLPFGFSY